MTHGVKGLCLCLLFCLCLSASPAVAFAQGSAGGGKGAARAAKNEQPEVTIQFGGVGMAQIENSPAELGYAELRVSAKYRGFDAGYELRSYRWNRTDGLPFTPGWKDPFNEMHTLWLGYERKGRIAQNWGWRAYGRLSSAFEDDVLGSPTGILAAGVNYLFSPEVIILAGVFASYNQADQFVLPYAGLLYRPGAQKGFSGSLGFPYSRLDYHLNQKLFLTLRTGFVRRTYKLAGDNPVRPNGEFRTRELSAGLSLGYALSKNWLAVLGADYLFSRDITFFDDGGEAGTDYDLENTWGLFCKLTFNF